ncbi:ribosome small subunit-dependent GTPase A, partial [Candidatus Kapabacteria bacterium]|nr:ribosome small subunit-dependent GTPase A [Candidatus Kapabacteria bacterium]
IELRDYLKNKTTIITGPSGVGKSSLVNFILDDHYQEIREVSKKTAKGIHTTSYVQMFNHPDGGQIVDTPGIREFALWDINKDELASYFIDFLDYNDDCKFLPCTHTHEPNCSIKEAVENGEIDLERYQSYLSLLESIVNKT